MFKKVLGWVFVVDKKIKQGNKQDAIIYSSYGWEKENKRVKISKKLGWRA